jgi:hypothetical protein
MADSLVFYLSEPILLVQDTAWRQKPDGFEPGGVQRLILLLGKGEDFWQYESKTGGNIAGFRQNAILVHFPDRKVFFKKCMIIRYWPKAY